MFRLSVEELEVSLKEPVSNRDNEEREVFGCGLLIFETDAKQMRVARDATR